MTVAIGERFVRRQQAARSSTSNTTAADVSYDTAVISDGSGYTYNGPDVQVDTAGRYLFVFDLGQCDLASTRACGTLIPRIGTSNDRTEFRATHRYLRNSGGSQEGASIGQGILDLAVNDTVRVRNPGTGATNTDAVGNYGTNVGYGGAMQLVYLGDGDWTHVRRTTNAAEVGTSNINTTRPWTDAPTGNNWTKITYNDEVADTAALYGGTGGDLTLAANTKYLIAWNVTAGSTDASRHTYVSALNVDGTRVQTSSGYQRNTASQGPPTRGIYLHETGGTTETIYLEATHEIEGGDAGTPNVHTATLQVVELPSSAEWIHVDNSETDSLTTALNGLTTWTDTPLSSTFRADGNSDLSLDSVNDAVQNDSGASLPIMAIGWLRWDRDSGSSGTRKNPWSRWDNGGSAVGYGVAGAYSRGQQSSDDTFQAHYVSAALMDLANGADLSWQHNDEASAANSDMGVYASGGGTDGNRHFLGVQVLNLDSLSGGSDANVTPATIAATAAVPSPTIAGGGSTSPSTIATTSTVPSVTVAGGGATTPASVDAVASVPAPSSIQGGGATSPSTIAAVSDIPTPSTGSAAEVTPATIDTTSTVPAPSVGAGSGVTPSTIDTVADVPTATPSGGGATTPSTITTTATIPTPSAAGGAGISPSSIPATAALPAPTTSGGSTVSPTTVAAIGELPSPTVGAGSGVSPITVSATVTIPTPTVNAAGGPTPATIAAVAAVPSPSVGAGSDVTPATVAATVDVPAPTTGSGADVTPSVVAAIVSVPAPSVEGGAGVDPAVVGAVVAIPTPATSGGSSADVTPATIDVTVDVPAPTVEVGSTIIPTTIAAVADLPSPSLGGGAGTSPSTIEAVVALPTPATSGGSTVAPSTVEVVATIPTPVLEAGAGVSPATIQAIADVIAPEFVGALLTVIVGDMATRVLSDPTATVSITAARATKPVDDRRATDSTTNPEMTRSVTRRRVTSIP